ncbi:hypothetical protein AAFF_G00135050 [Aldrovandia affinis]|uniref:Reverse transcriptase domain-containing protein n=1 Tax=Aldrovandia affinis TaxID=143900 RepID=A0AAD7RQ22_9TELE|nr:hypothetical protein AAFF_G00135050 [Aldrovandia affinis]
MEDLNKQVTMMFVRNFPDPALTMVFKCKLVENWTAKEVQERIDEHQRRPCDCRREDSLAMLAGVHRWTGDEVPDIMGMVKHYGPGFYNVLLHKDDNKFTTFSSPAGLHKYNSLSQELFMWMTMNITGDQNVMSLLCYLEDLMVFAPNDREAMKRLQMVFEWLRGHLKLTLKKCHLLTFKLSALS